MSAVRLVLLVAASALAACGGGSGATPDAAPGDASPTADAAPDAVAVDLFAADHVLDVELDVAPLDWATLLAQSRSLFAVLGQSCLSAPAASPFTYFPATVRIDGVELERVGVRKKGFFGSLSTVKPSLKVNFDELVPGQTYGGLDKLTLNNALSDPSYVKQCLGYGLFAAAGIPAPRCAFARVTTNGAPLGLFVHVESVDKRFLRRHFADEDGDLFEGALSDFRPGWVETFAKKTNELDPDRARLHALTAALERPDDQLLAALEPLIDVDRFLTFWAMELLIMHADGYARNTNNFFAYDDPTTGRFELLPWGIDSILFEDVALPWEATRPPDGVWAEGALAWRLYRHPPTQARFRARLGELLDAVWDEPTLLAEIDRLEALIAPSIPAAEAATAATAIDDVRAFVRGRRAVLEASLVAEPAPWTAPLRDPWCIDALGELAAPFATTWGTHDAADPFATGTSSLDVTLPGATYDDLAGGATAGRIPDTGKTAIRAVALTTATTVLVIHVEVAPELVVPGASLAIDWVEASGYLLRLDFEPEPDQIEVVGLIGDGTLTFDQAGDTPGAPVTGTITGTIYESIF